MCEVDDTKELNFPSSSRSSSTSYVFGIRVLDHFSQKRGETVNLK